ncbi:hypothetical protein [Streptomyces sp. enrichment culture]|uniref:hypothetical protein n=1 Tax=Streptomyces sp. enrichment culture TaxID=1795815 RepID=UPI003F56F72E
MMQNKGLAALAVVAASVITAGCSTSNTHRAETPSAQGHVVVVDGDSHGYVTFDTEREVLSGYTSDGKKAWQERRYFPTDVHCVSSCPDAVISATAEMNDSGSKTHVIWKRGDGSTTRLVNHKSMVVQWARNKDTWVATSESALIWSDAGRVHRKPFTSGIIDSTGRISEDRSTLLVSVQQAGAAHWSAFRFALTGTHLSPSSVSTRLPGSIGCVSPSKETMWTLGEKASEFSLTTGKEIRGTAQFASDCVSSETSTLLGAFSADTEESTQEISITSGSRHSPLNKVTVKSAGELGVYRHCGVLLSDGRLASLSPQGKKVETTIPAHSMLTVPGGRIYSVGSSGKVEQHTITAKSGTCRIT